MYIQMALVQKKAALHWARLSRIFPCRLKSY